MPTIKEKHIPDYYAAEIEEITPMNLMLAKLGHVDLVLCGLNGVLRNFRHGEDTIIPPSKKRAIEKLGKAGIGVGIYTDDNSGIIEELRYETALGDVMDPALIQGSEGKRKLRMPRGDGLVQFGELGYHSALFIGEQIYSDVAAVHDARRLLAKKGDDSFSISSVIVPPFGKDKAFWLRNFHRLREGEVKDALHIPRGRHMIPPGIFKVKPPEAL